MNDARAPRAMTRRRFIQISAAFAASAAAPGASRASAETWTWNGVVLGAEASLTLQHPQESAAKSAIADCLAEVARLEAIFSLHRPDSALSRLNAQGYLDGAPADLRVLLAHSLALARQTNGAFDPTIQLLWRAYADHFSTPAADQDGPPPEIIAAASARTGWQHVALDGGRIEFLKPNMEMTLNGIAQGYITDKAGELLKSRGFSNVLINLGEQLALGPKWDGEAWSVGIAGPVEDAPLLLRLPLTQGALATSGGYGCCFDKVGRFGHILDPQTGRPAARWKSMSVLAACAAEADGLSTAFSVMSADDIKRHLNPGLRVFALTSEDHAYWL